MARHADQLKRLVIVVRTSVISRKFDRDHPAQRHSDKHEVFEAERRDKPFQVEDVRGDGVVEIGRPFAVAVATKVKRKSRRVPEQAPPVSEVPPAKRLPGAHLRFATPRATGVLFDTWKTMRSRKSKVGDCRYS
jgi:hypothetical protein